MTSIRHSQVSSNGPHAHPFACGNGVRAIIVQATDHNQSVIAISVNGGHFSDPVDCQGLAHLLEHMLFMGSTNFPRPNQCIAEMEQLGGSLNAFTSGESLTLQARCPSSVVKSALAILYDMILNPLFELSSIENEILTIDAEFHFKRQDDLRRLYQVHKETCNPQHPFSQFSVGNKDIFKSFSLEQLKQKLRSQHQRMMAANQITICIFSDNNIQSIEKCITATFGRLPPNQSSIEKKVLPALYLSSQISSEISVRPLTDSHRLIVTFSLPGVTAEQVSALSFISYLIGNESAGSISEQLKSYGWITSLNAGGGIEGSNFRDYNINMQLTEKGEEHRYDIVQAVLCYIKLIKFPEQWRLDEHFELEQIHHNTPDQSANLDTATNIANHMHAYPTDKLLDLAFGCLLFTQQTVNELLNYFSTEYMRIKYISPKAPTSKKAMFYDTEYGIQKISEQISSGWANHHNDNVDLCRLVLPPPNPYMVLEENPLLTRVTFDKPQCIQKDKRIECWVSADQENDSLEADAYLSLEFPEHALSAYGVATKKLWLACIQEHLQRDFYPAEVAGLHYRLYAHQSGLTLHTSGRNSHQEKLFDDLIDKIFTYTISEDLFNRKQSQLTKSLQNSLLNKPINRLFSRLGVLMQRHTNSHQEVLTEISQLSVGAMKLFKENSLPDTSAQILLHGSWCVEHAKNITKTLVKNINNHTSLALITREIVRLQPQYTYFHPVDSHQDDAAALLFLQAPSNSALDTALTMIFEQLLATPFFNQLRSEKKLGYVVGSGLLTHNAYAGMVFYVQSPFFSAQTLVNEMTHFLMNQLNHLDYYRQFWPKIQQNIVRQLLAIPQSSSARAQRFWIELGLQDYTFDRQQRIADIVTNMTFEELVVHAKELRRRKTFGELVLFCHGGLAPTVDFTKRSTAKTFEEISKFKDHMRYFS